MNRVLVTGATGCVGHAVVAALQRDGWAVRGLARGPAPASWPGTQLHRCSVEDAAGIRAAADGCEAIVHLAGWVHRVPRGPCDCEALRLSVVGGTRNVIEAARGARLVHASSVAVYGSLPKGPVDEATPLRADTPYGRAKQEAEEIVRERVPAASILRITLVYGPHDRGNLARLLRAVDRRLAFVVGGGDNRKSLVFADNLADRVALLLRRDLPGTFIVADAAPTQAELMEALARALGRRPPRAIPRAPVLLAARAIDWVGGSSWAERVLKLSAATEFVGTALDQRLGYSARVSLEEGLARTVAWYRRVG